MATTEEINMELTDSDRINMFQAALEGWCFGRRGTPSGFEWESFRDSYLDDVVDDESAYEAVQAAMAAWDEMHVRWTSHTEALIDGTWQHCGDDRSCKRPVDQAAANAELEHAVATYLYDWLTEAEYWHHDDPEANELPTAYRMIWTSDRPMGDELMAEMTAAQVHKAYGHYMLGSNAR